MIRNKRFKTPYPQTNGSTIVKLDDPSVLQNKSAGRISGWFRSVKRTDTTCLFSATNENHSLPSNNHTYVMLNLLGGIQFTCQNGSLDLGFYGGSKGEWTDDKWHYFDIIANASSSSISVDGVNQSLTYTNPSQIFTDSIITEANIGNQIYTNSSVVSEIRPFKGLISEISVYDTDLSTKIITYNAGYNGIESDSSEVYKVNNNLLNLSISGTELFDVSDQALTITPSSTLASVDDKFGRKRAVEFDASLEQNASFTPITLDRNGSAFRVRFKLNSFASGNYVESQAILSNQFTSFQNLTAVGTSLRLETNTNNEFALGKNVDFTYGIWYDLICVFNNSTCYSYLNNKLIDTKVITNDLTFSKINGVLDVGNKTFSNLVIDKLQFFDYALSSVDRKALYRAVPKRDTLTLITDQTGTKSPVNIRTTRTASSDETIINFGDGFVDNVLIDNEYTDYSYASNNNRMYQIKVGNLKNLTSFVAKDSLFAGKIPKNINKGLNLHTIAFQNTEMTGELYEKLGELINLEYIYIAFSNFTSISDSLNNLTNLRLFQAQENAFSGAVPFWLNSPRMHQVFINGCNIDGTDLDDWVAAQWAVRNVRGSHSCDIKIQDNASGISADSVARIEGTGLYLNDGLVQAGCTVTYTAA